MVHQSWDYCKWKSNSSAFEIIYFCTFGRRAVASLPAYWQNGHIWRPDGHCGGMGPDRGKILFCSQVSYYMPSDRTKRPLMAARRPLWWAGAGQRENPPLLKGKWLHTDLPVSAYWAERSYMTAIRPNWRTEVQQRENSHFHQRYKL
jgi:hypothetical protein